MNQLLILIQMMEDDEDSTSLYMIIALLYLIVYLCVSSYLEVKKLPLHRTAVAIIIGVVTGLILSLAAPDIFKDIAQLDEFIVFSVLYPPMIFAQGYTLHKSVLFKNIKYIITFGLLGTFISFLISWGLIYEANDLDLVIDVKDIHNFRSLSDWEILLLAACLCSIDTTASQQSVNEYKHPRLYSIIFGEDVLKDAVTIVLFSSILNLEDNQTPDKLVIYWYTFFEVLLNFIVLVLGSVAAGLVASGIAIFLNKKFRFMAKDDGVTETGFLFLIGFFTYILTEMLDFSGSISLLLYGIMLNHYNSYNMTKKGHEASVVTFSLLSNISEGILFLIMGIMVCQGQWQSPDSTDETMTHSYIFFAIVMSVLLFARFVNIYVIGFIGRFIFPKKFKMHNQEMHILFLGGLVRGAVPFVLFSSVSFYNDTKYAKNQGVVLKTTIIFVITFTSVILNSIIPLITKKRLKKMVLEQKQKLIGNHQKQLSINQIKEQGEEKKIGKLKNFQQKYIKPFLIFDYIKRKDQIYEEKKKTKAKWLLQAQQDQLEDELLTQDNDKIESKQ